MVTLGKLKGNKKGSIQDILIIGVVLLFFGVIILIGYKVMYEVNEKVQASDLPEARGKAASAKLTGYFPTVVDNSFLFMALGLSIASLVLASLVRVHPIFISFFIIGLIVLIFLCGVFSNIYQEMASNAALQSLADDLTFTTKILNTLPFIVGIMGSLLSIIMYKNWRSVQI